MTGRFTSKIKMLGLKKRLTFYPQPPTLEV